MLEDGIYALLSNDAALTALVGASGIYPVMIPDTASFPCLSYQVAADVSDLTLDSENISNTRVQFDVWGSVYGDCKAVVRTLRALLDGYSGTLPDGTLIKGTFRGISVDNFERDSKCFRILAEYRFIY